MHAAGLRGGLPAVQITVDRSKADRMAATVSHLREAAAPAPAAVAVRGSGRPPKAPVSRSSAPPAGELPERDAATLERIRAAQRHTARKFSRSKYFSAVLDDGTVVREVGPRMVYCMSLPPVVAELLLPGYVNKNQTVVFRPLGSTSCVTQRLNVSQDRKTTDISLRGMGVGVVC
jgi:hypothetical protein